MIDTQVLLNGLVLGALYACIAVGFSLVWGVLNIINLLHGSLIVLGAYLALLAFTYAGLHPFMSLLPVAVAMFGFGYVLQRLVLNRVISEPVLVTLVLTFGLDLLLYNAMVLSFTATPRRILLDHAKARLRVQRGGGQRRVSFELSGVADLAADESETILAVDEAFRRLEAEDSQAAAVVRLRFYAGLSVEQTAQILDISARTVAREWTFARSWLARALGDSLVRSNAALASGEAMRRYAASSGLLVVGTLRVPFSADGTRSVPSTWRLKRSRASRYCRRRSIRSTIPRPASHYRGRHRQGQRHLQR